MSRIAPVDHLPDIETAEDVDFWLRRLHQLGGSVAQRTFLTELLAKYVDCAATLQVSRAGVAHLESENARLQRELEEFAYAWDAHNR